MTVNNVNVTEELSNVFYNLRLIMHHTALYCNALLLTIFHITCSVTPQMPSHHIIQRWKQERDKSLYERPTGIHCTTDITVHVRDSTMSTILHISTTKSRKKWDHGRTKPCSHRNLLFFLVCYNIYYQ